MPWNSSKSKINVDHPIFKIIGQNIVDALIQYSKISKSFSGKWDEQVFKFSSGNVDEVIVADKKILRNYFPPVPKKSRVAYKDEIADKNTLVSNEKPWTIGLYESIIAVDAIGNLNLAHKNRIMLILLDSTLEIAFKEFLVNHPSHALSESRLATLSRGAVENEVKSLVLTLLPAVWIKVTYYYNQRCALIHKRATVEISNEQIEDFRGLTESLLTAMFGLDFTV